jgi:hypothetical protein
MRKTELEKRLRRMARAAGVEVGLLRQGGGHEVWQYGGLVFMIPRHNEINEHTARGILRACEQEA